MFTLPDRIKPQTVVQQIPKFHQNPWVFVVAAALIVVCSLVFHTLPNKEKLQQVKASINTADAESSKMEKEIIEKGGDREKWNQELELFEETNQPRIDKVFPDNEGIGEMTRFLERFALQLEKTGLITLSTISYGTSKNNGEYSELPIRLSFQANNINFVRFMQMIKNSGSLKEKDFYEGEPVRLMKVNRISVAIPNLIGDSDIAEQLYSINLELSAFFHES